jgi:hypothetical protein
MPRKSKAFWAPWAASMLLAAMLILVGAFTPNSAGAQAPMAKAAKAQVTATASMAYIDVRTVPIVEVPASQPASAPAKVKGADDATGLVSILRTALKGSRWGLAVAAALALLVLVLRLGASRLRVLFAKGTRPERFLAWCGTDRGGAWLVLASGAATGIVNALGAGQALTVDLLFESAAAAAASSTGAAGLYVIAKKLISPSDKSKPTR